MELAFKLEAFEGPLDLLLHLIEKNKVNIYDIPIVEITDQYLEYVEAMDREDLDLVSEFLVMAATLLDIKSRMLLPVEEEEKEEAEDPRQELVERLLEYRKYKYISEELRDYQILGDQLEYREPSIPKEVLNYREPVDLQELLGDLTLERLKSIYNDVMRRREDKIDPVRSSFGKIEREQVQISDTIVRVRSIMKKGTRHSFRSLLKKGATKIEVVVTFLAILELIKVGDICLTEDSTRDDIIIEGKVEYESGSGT
ncbi:MAG: segregation/condensation protein A [Clostridiales bacterium]|nr:segregation/condensation protein A [Clostridiales bacterium]